MRGRHAAASPRAGNLLLPVFRLLSFTIVRRTSRSVTLFRVFLTAPGVRRLRGSDVRRQGSDENALEARSGRRTVGHPADVPARGLSEAGGVGARGVRAGSP